jgi:hypothetical protein
MAQTVRRRGVTAEAPVRSQASPRGMFAGMGQAFPRVVVPL